MDETLAFEISAGAGSAQSSGECGMMSTNSTRPRYRARLRDTPGAETMSGARGGFRSWCGLPQCPCSAQMPAVIAPKSDDRGSGEIQPVEQASTRSRHASAYAVAA